MKSHINLFFLGGGKRVSMAERFIQSGKEMGFDVRILSYELNVEEPVSLVGRIIVGKKWDDPAILEHLKEVCYDENVHMIIPFWDQATLIASRLKKEMRDIFIAVPEEEVCQMFFDKISSNNWFKENDFPVPSADLLAPMIAKPRKGRSSKGILLLENNEKLTAFMDDPRKDNYLVQGYIKGDEYSVDCYVSTTGEIVTIVPRKRIEVVSGEVTKTMTVKDEQIIELSEQMLRASKLVGPVTLQFIKDRASGEVYFMEVNLRFGGGTIASIEAGADIPEMILRDYLGLPNYPVTDWKENLLMMRAYREFFRYNHLN